MLDQGLVVVLAVEASAVKGVFDVLTSAEVRTAAAVPSVAGGSNVIVATDTAWEEQEVAFAMTAHRLHLLV